jgi:hypothetical protein
MKRPLHRSPTTFAVSLLAGGLFLCQPASAYDPTGNEIADAFLSLLESEQGTVESYGAVTESGGTVSIESLKLADENDKNLGVTIAQTDLSGGELLSTGRLKLSKLAMTGLNMDADDGSLSIAAFSSTDLVLPSPSEMSKSDDKAPVSPSYADLEILGTTVQDENGNQATAARIFVAIDEMDGDIPTASHFAVEGLVIDAESLDDDGKKALTDLGYDKLTLVVTGSGKWDPEAATLVLDNLTISGQDAATLQLSLSLGGLTREVVNKLNKTQDEPEKALGLIQGITVQSLSLKVDNDSLVERILDRQAKEAGTDRAGLVAQLEGGLPLMLSLLQNPDFQAKVATALGSFLKEPGTLEIIATPGAPVPVAQIMGAAMMAPQTLPQVLGVGISANGSNE